MRANVTAWSGWMLLAGFGLTTLGLATQPQNGSNQANDDPGGPPVVTQGGSTTVMPVSGFGTSDSNGSMIAVTGIDVTGSSILYLVDTEHKQLAVYQANGGSANSMGLKFVAGRRIDLDLQVYGYNDDSEHSYREMVEEFERHESR